MKPKYCLMLLILVAVAATAASQNDDLKKAGRTVSRIPKNIDPKTGTHIVVDSIGNTEETKFGRLTAFALTPEQNILACDAESNRIKVIDPNGKTIDTWRLDFAPYVIHSCRCGEVFAAGVGTVAKFDKNGNLAKQVKAENSTFPNTKAAGIGVFASNVFVAFAAEGAVDSRAVIVRFNRDFSNPTVIAKNMRPCGGRLDLVAWEDVLYVAESARHRVLRMDPKGKILSKWTSGDPDNIPVSARGCNTMAIYYSPDNTLYTAESGLGRIKRYTPLGKFIDLVGYAKVAPFDPANSQAQPRSNMAVAATKDGSRVYALDYKNNLIKVLERKN